MVWPATSILVGKEGAELKRISQTRIDSLHHEVGEIATGIKGKSNKTQNTVKAVEGLKTEAGSHVADGKLEVSALDGFRTKAKRSKASRLHHGSKGGKASRRRRRVSKGATGKTRRRRRASKKSSSRRSRRSSRRRRRRRSA